MRHARSACPYWVCTIRLDDQGAGGPLGLDLLEQLGDAAVLAVAPGVEADQPERVVLDLPIVDVAALAGR